MELKQRATLGDWVTCAGLLLAIWGLFALVGCGGEPTTYPSARLDGGPTCPAECVLEENKISPTCLRLCWPDLGDVK